MDLNPVFSGWLIKGSVEANWGPQRPADLLVELLGTQSELIGEIAMDLSPLFVGGLIGERDIDRIPVFVVGAHWGRRYRSDSMCLLVGSLGAQSELIGERDTDRSPVFVVVGSLKAQSELIGERDIGRIPVFVSGLIRSSIGAHWGNSYGLESFVCWWAHWGKRYRSDSCVCCSLGAQSELIGERDIDRIPVFVGGLIGGSVGGTHWELIGERNIDRILGFFGGFIGGSVGAQRERDMDWSSLFVGALIRCSIGTHWGKRYRSDSFVCWWAH
ncbi:hypothetical protein GQR58_014937 [Nymphon striatum]|nr:hypothetical protein GQR58_014937 [Nymphon striatum]